jgi:hypothetical protein
MEKGVTFLCRILKVEAYFYVENLPRVIILRDHFSTTYTEKNDPKAMNSNDPKAINFTEKGTFLCRIVTGGSNFYVEKMTPRHYSTGSFFYNLHGEK